tara:strand:+ start:2532 stop:2669 length:138 start_codon:yes stop_codon:yes gene_type:complete
MTSIKDPITIMGSSHGMNDFVVRAIAIGRQINPHRRLFHGFEMSL